MSAPAYPLKAGRRPPTGDYYALCGQMRLIRQALKPKKPSRPGVMSRVEYVKRNEPDAFAAIAEALQKKGADRAKIAKELKTSQKMVLAVAVHLKLAPAHGIAKRRAA